MACGRAHVRRWPAPRSRSAEDCRKAASPTEWVRRTLRNPNRQTPATTSCNNFDWMEICLKLYLCV